MAMHLYPDQAKAFDLISDILRASGVDLVREVALQTAKQTKSCLAVLGRAGSGKTAVLAKLATELAQIEGMKLLSEDFEPRGLRDSRSLCILAPTNKAASVLRGRGVPATTIHRVLYRPVYDPEYERIAEWLLGQGKRPDTEALSAEALDRAKSFYDRYPSIPGAMAAAGLRGSDFIKGWKRREEALDIGLVDEASMLDQQQLEDLADIFPILILFGDPAQLAPVGNLGEMCFDRLEEEQRVTLSRIHRQTEGNPIIELAHALSDPALGFDDFEAMISRLSREDDRVMRVPRAQSALMARSPMLVWRNATRIRLIHGFRKVYGIPEDGLMPGEPLICDGIELPAKHRKKRIDLEARGLIKGAQAVYLGPGRKAGFSRLHLMGAHEPQLSVASIINIEQPDDEEPFIPTAARMGAAFVHGAACTIHKAQGSQWETVQVFAPDLYAAARMGRVEAGIPLWKRLAYVAITRAQHRLIWVTDYRLSRPEAPLGVDDLLAEPASQLTLQADDVSG